jgi:hypothetical protein
VDSHVHSYLSEQKRDNETFNDALRRLLDINPDLDTIAAYLTPEQRELFHRVVTAVEESANVVRRFASESSYEGLQFESADSGQVLVEIQIHENPSESKFVVSYRNQKQRLEELGTVKMRDGSLSGYILGDYGSFDDSKEFIQAVETKTSQAAAAWG